MESGPGLYHFGSTTQEVGTLIGRRMSGWLESPRYTYYASGGNKEKYLYITL